MGKTDKCMKAGDGRSEGEKGQPPKSVGKRRKSVSKKEFSFKERQEEKSKVRQRDFFCPVRRDEEHGLKKGIDAHCTNAETL